MLVQIIPVIVFIVYLVLYSVLRTCQYEVYYKRYYFDRPEYYNNICEWIRFLLTIKEKKLIEYITYDGYFFLRFHLLAIKIKILLLPLILLNLINKKFVYILNIYYLTFISLYFLSKEIDYFVKIRQNNLHKIDTILIKNCGKNPIMEYVYYREINNSVLVKLDSPSSLYLLETVPINNYNVLRVINENDIIEDCVDKKRHYLMSGLYTFLVVFFYTIPFGFLPLLNKIKFIRENVYISNYLPVILLNIFFNMIPCIMRHISNLENHSLKSTLYNKTLEKVMIFLVFSIFLAYTITGSAIEKIKQIIDGINDIRTLILSISNKLSSQSKFFINYIYVLSLYGNGNTLLSLGGLFMVNLNKYVLHKSSNLQNDVYFCNIYSYPLLVFLISTCFTVITPMILLSSILYFSTSYFVYLNQLLYYYNKPIELYGSYFLTVYRFYIFTLIFTQIIIQGLLLVNGLFYSIFLLVPLILFTFYYSSFRLNNKLFNYLDYNLLFM